MDYDRCVDRYGQTVADMLVVSEAFFKKEFAEYEKQCDDLAREAMRRAAENSIIHGTYFLSVRGYTLVGMTALDVTRNEHYIMYQGGREIMRCGRWPPQQGGENQ